MKTSSNYSFIFDLDGTSCNTIYDLADCANYALRCLNLKEKDYDYFPPCLGQGLKVFCKKILGIENEKYFDKMYDIFYNRYKENPATKTIPYENIVQSLTYAKEKGIKLYCYTNKEESMAIQVLDHCFGKNFFNKIVGATSGVQCKPDPTRFLSQCKDENINFSKAAYFGDSALDIQTGKNLNCKYIFSVLWGYSPKEKIQSCNITPTAFLEKPDQIFKIIDEIISKKD